MQISFDEYIREEIVIPRHSPAITEHYTVIMREGNTAQQNYVQPFAKRVMANGELKHSTMLVLPGEYAKECSKIWKKVIGREPWFSRKIYYFNEYAVFVLSPTTHFYNQLRKEAKTIGFI